MGEKYGNGRFFGLFTLVKYGRCEYSLDKENGMYCYTVDVNNTTADWFK